MRNLLKNRIEEVLVWIIVQGVRPRSDLAFILSVVRGFLLLLGRFARATASTVAEFVLVPAWASLEKVSQVNILLRCVN